MRLGAQCQSQRCKTATMRQCSTVHNVTPVSTAQQAAGAAKINLFLSVAGWAAVGSVPNGAVVCIVAGDEIAELLVALRWLLQLYAKL